MEKEKNSITIDGENFVFIEDKIKERENCINKCDLHDICFSKLKSDNMICRIHFNENVKNGYYQKK